MKIQRPTVGPIVGYTRTTETRIWLRGDFQQTPEGYRRAFGVVRMRASPGVPGAAGAPPLWGDPRFVKLAPYFDMTGVCVFADLTADTEYEYQAGWFFAETELSDLGATPALDWSQAVTARFRSAAVAGASPRAYAVGSCRYLLRLFGGSIFDGRGDKTFRSILDQHATPGTRVDGLMMLGDQIYADDLRDVSPDEQVDEYLSRYRAVFSQAHVRQLMASVPTYMILDDHEIEDNWPSRAEDRDWLTRYPAAIHAYQIYQCSHSPLFGLDADGRIEGTLDKFWYTFEDGCCDWFVLDTRTERTAGPPASRSEIINARQMAALLKWLGDDSGQVKMIATSVPFFPDSREEDTDKWSGFLAQREKILDFIFTHAIRRVVFLSGDVHCSFVAELTSPDDPAFKVVSVVSSSFYWPYPHTRVGSFQMKGKLKTTKDGREFAVHGPREVHNTDNFARVTVTPAGIDVAFFERKGDKLGESQHRF